MLAHGSPRCSPSNIVDHHLVCGGMARFLSFLVILGCCCLICDRWTLAIIHEINWDITPLKKKKKVLTWDTQTNQLTKAIFVRPSRSHQSILTPPLMFGYIAKEISNHTLLLVKPNQLRSEFEFKLQKLINTNLDKKIEFKLQKLINWSHICSFYIGVCLFSKQ